MKTTFNVWGIISLLTFLTLTCACSQKKYAPARYTSAQDRFGDIELQTVKKVYLCPTIDSLQPKCRKLLDPAFTPYEHVTDAFEKELLACGVTPLRPDFEFGPDFDSLQQVIKEKANQSENAVYLGTELLWLSRGQLSLDAKLYDPSGTILFEKRGVCMIFGLLNDEVGKEGQEIAHMTLRQILADPQFNQVLQK